jgi:hypothetical protein
MEKLSIENGKELHFVANVDTQAVDIFLFDPFSESKTRLATFANEFKIPGGVWKGTNDVNGINLFFQLSKKYPKIIKKKINACKEYLWTNGEQSINKTWDCFKRRVIIKIHKLTR